MLSLSTYTVGLVEHRPPKHSLTKGQQKTTCEMIQEEKKKDDHWLKRQPCIRDKHLLCIFYFCSFLCVTSVKQTSMMPAREKQLVAVGNEI